METVRKGVKRGLLIIVLALATTAVCASSAVNCGTGIELNANLTYTATQDWHSLLSPVRLPWRGGRRKRGTVT